MRLAGLVPAFILVGDLNNYMNYILSPDKLSEIGSLNSMKVRVECSQIKNGVLSVTVSQS